MTTAISSFRGGVMVDVIGCPPMAVDHAIVESIIQLCKDASIFKNAFEHSVDASADVDTTDNDAITIDLSDYVSDTLRPYTVLDLKIDGSSWGTEYFDLDSDVDEITVYQNADTKFFNFPDVGTIKIFPMDTTDDVLVYLKMVWLPLATMTSVDDRIYNDYRHAVEAWAKWYLMRQPGKAWTDVNLADYHMAEYARTMKEAKIEMLHGKTFGSMQVKSRRFF